MANAKECFNVRFKKIKTKRSLVCVSLNKSKQGGGAISSINCFFNNMNCNLSYPTVLEVIKKLASRLLSGKRVKGSLGFFMEWLSLEFQ